MSVYKRGGVYWYKFSFGGQAIRESAKTASKTVARDAERARRRELELGINGLTKRERPLFPLAAKDWLAMKLSTLTPLGARYYRQYIAKLSCHFGNRLISDITAEDVAELQRKRKAEGLSGRHINAEIGTLRAILRYYGRWAFISGRVGMLPQRSDVGRALNRDDEAKLLQAIGESHSLSLYPFFVLSLDAGLRPSETRGLRRSNLRLEWRDGAIIEGEIIVGRSKTDAGTGRVVPLTRRACAALTLWLSRFPNVAADAYVFPFHHVAIAGYERRPCIHDVKLDQPMSPSSYKSAFHTARRKAEVAFRFYDARHTFVTRLAENPAVSEETIRQLAGHVSPRMLGRYAHIRVQARRAAIASLEEAGQAETSADFVSGRAQNWAQSADSSKPVLN
jgi:integrase